MGIHNPPRFRRSRRPVANLGVAGLIIAILASLAIAGPSLAATSLHNGSFEHGHYEGPSTWQTLFPDDTNLNGWTVTQDSIDWVNSYWQAAKGTKSIDLNGNRPGGIRQTFSTIANGTYVVTFSLSGNPESGRPAHKTMTIDVGGAATAYAYDTSVHGNTFSHMKYITESYSFAALPNTDSTTLTFTSTTPGDAGPVLDDIVVTQTTPLVFNAADGFRVAPNQANPSGVWSYRQKDPGGGRSLLTYFDASAEDLEGLEAWSGTEVEPDHLPSVTYNNTGHDQPLDHYHFGGTSPLPAGGLAAHPGADHPVVIRWTSPSAGLVSIRLGLLDLDPRFGGTSWGDGVRGSIGKPRHPVVSGAIANGGQQAPIVVRIRVRAHDRIELKINGAGDHHGDTTQVDLTITLFPS
jgi:choice-of-anchor C domain-containing protein